ncbi:MAG: O-antigen acetylase [uncultured Thiotrichaceae bacterium]|uniref:O-antigen acetylase n=1 Tax=uncultured Thiotrichaceae bacterium TaxID=298394 RepID=A0A6S6U9K9_9GAMM|nr:MAG: O-antigen acetylase [uncultured Thiotrichaceae bacterium]
MQYRKEIDGLRALAVVPVILFHAGIQGFSGGFVGVDIFFVISGYLITSIIVAELETGDFTISGFYERRARRILPALFFVILVSLPLAWWLLLPHELVAFGRSIIAVMVFASNILFWQESDYFATDSELIPLLHTWSLAVEEQYYIIFPILLLVCWKLGLRWVTAILATIAVISLGLAEWGWRHDASGNFYLLPSRVWELMAGAGCALYLSNKPQPTGTLSQVLSLSGLGLLMLSILWLDDTIPFPGIYAILPVLGTALIILFAHQGNWTGKLLSLPALVGIGLVSYSAYLWHQPMFAFARLYYAEEPGLVIMSGLAVLTFGLAFISWRFVERPFRQRQNFSRKQIFIMALMGSIAFVLIALAFIMLEGIPARFA